MNLTVYSHKVCWPSPRAATGFATDGGFAFQMQALSELFDGTTLVVPCVRHGGRTGETPLEGHRLTVRALTSVPGTGFVRRLLFPLWLLRNAVPLLRTVADADAIHTPIPGDVGTVGLVLAWVTGRRLFVRHCGNWFHRRTTAEWFWAWFMERQRKGRNVMLATGGGRRPPSVRNPRLRWIFSTSLTRAELSRLRRRRRERAGDPPRVIIVCRQVEAKGAGTVIRALPEIARTVGGVQLDVVGDGPARATFHRLAGKLGMTDRVTFHGAVGHERVLELLRRADVFCFPTRSSEGFPKVVLEAMACGLPVIASRVSVLPALLGGGAGIVLDEPSAHAVARAVQYCFGDPAAYARLSSRAIHVAQDFSLERWARDIGSELTRAWGPLQKPEIGHGTRRRASTAR